MKQRTLIALLAFIIAAASAFSQDRDWQTGKLLTIEAGKLQTDYLATGPGSGERTVRHIYRPWIYVVETNTAVYRFSAYTGPTAEDHPYALTIGSEVRFALDPSKPDRAYLVDEKGKEFRASVIKTTARRP